MAKMTKQDLKVGQTSKNALGYSVWWTLHEKEVAVPDFEKILENTIGVAYKPGAPRKKRALRLALESIEQAGLIVKIRDDESVLAYGLADEELDSANIDFKLTKKNIIVLDKDSGKIRFTLSHKNAEIEKQFLRYQEVYTEKDFRPVALAYLYNNNGITLRESGGIYFIPNETAMLNLKKYFEALGCEFNFLAIIPDVASKTQVSEIATKEFKRDLELAAADVELYTKKDDTRDSTLASRLKHFETLYKRAECYGDLLELKSDDLKKQIKDLRGKVEKALMGDSKEWPQSKDYPYKSRVKFTDPGDEYDGALGTVVGYDAEGKGKVATPVCKVLFDDGTIFPVYAMKEYLKRV